jgi:hypothetical protein
MRASGRIRRADREVAGPSSKASISGSIPSVSNRSPFHDNSMQLPAGSSPGLVSTQAKVFFVQLNGGNA